MNFYAAILLSSNLGAHLVYVYFFRKRIHETREVDNVCDMQVEEQNQVFIMPAEKSGVHSHCRASISHTSFERIAPHLRESPQLVAS